MNDNIKLIIEIPKKEYEAFKELIAINIGRCSGKGIIQTCLNAVKNGTPLDDVKLKIEQDMSWDMFNDYGNETAIHKELWEILDNIGKPESEDEE